MPINIRSLNGKRAANDYILLRKKYNAVQICSGCRVHTDKQAPTDTSVHFVMVWITKGLGKMLKISLHELIEYDL